MKISPINVELYPLLDGPAIPWALIEPHERQAKINHNQSLVHLAGRGGLGMSEAVAILEDRRWTYMPDIEAKAKLEEIVTTRYYLPRVAELETRLKEAEATVEMLKVEVNGANERCRILLDAKNYWADRCRDSEAKREEAERVLWAYTELSDPRRLDRDWIGEKARIYFGERYFPGGNLSTMIDDDKIIYICDKCHTAACWLGIFMCNNAVTAGLIKTTVGEHRQSNPSEHEDYYTTEYDKAVGQ